MRVKHIVRYMNLDGRVIKEEFDDMDDSSERFEELKREGKVIFLDLEIHSVISLKCITTGK